MLEDTAAVKVIWVFSNVAARYGTGLMVRYGGVGNVLHRI
jgi:hypothetical protein